MILVGGHARLYRSLTALAFTLSLAFSGLSLQASPAFAQEVPVEVSGVTAPGPSTQRYDADKQASVVQQGFDLLMDQYVRPLKSAELLGGAWALLTQEAARVQAAPPGKSPAFTGNRSADIATYRAALSTYVKSLPAVVPNFDPAEVSVRGMVAVVHEGHTYFLDPGQYQQRLAFERGEGQKFVGIGISVQGPPITVTHVYKGTPAEEAGLQVGDVIVSVDSHPIAGLSDQQTATLIRGNAGTSVQLQVSRPGEAGPRTFQVVRREIILGNVEYEMLPSQVGYVLLRGFPDVPVMGEVEGDIQALENQGATSLILDLRGNSGGAVDAGIRLLSDFLPAGTPVLQAVDRQGAQVTAAVNGGQQFQLPLAVLVDGGSASMAEIFAADIQEENAGFVLGQTTSGNVAGARTFPLPDNSALAITVVEARSGLGRQLNGVGVVPDETITSDLSSLASGDDLVVSRASALLTQGQTDGGGADGG